MKAIKYLILILIPLISFVSCTSKTQKLQQEYIEACADGDFDKAHGIVDKLETVNTYRAIEGMKYVNDKEIYVLLAKASREADSRIIYLYNTYESEQLPDMTDVLEVAISSGRENLAEKLLKSGVTPNGATITAAVLAENEDLVDLILSKNNTLIFEEGVADFYKQAKGKEALTTIMKQILVSTPSNNGNIRNNIADMAKKLDISDLDKIIADAASEDIKNKIKELYEFKVPTCPVTGLIKSDYHGNIPHEYIAYKRAVEEFNSLCISVINDAISNHLPQMANKVLSLMKPNLDWTDLGDWEDVVVHSTNSSVYHAYKVRQTNSQMTMAKKIFQQHHK